MPLKSYASTRAEWIWSPRHVLDLDTFDLDRLVVRQWSELQREPAPRLKERVADLGPLIARLPAEERDIIDLRFRRRWSEARIAAVMGGTQQATAHRIATAIRRLRVLIELPEVDLDEMEADFRRWGLTVCQQHALIAWARLIYQSVAADDVWLTQQQFCKATTDGLARLRRQSHLRAATYVNFFEVLRRVPWITRRPGPLDAGRRERRRGEC